MTCLACLCVALLCATSFLTTSALATPQTLSRRHFLISSDHDYGRRDLMGLKNVTWTEDAQKGKGSYGGANVVHRRPAQKSAAPLHKPCFLVLSASLGFFALLLAFHLHYPD
ncbi:hypothetical protein Salat_2814800 [Sesamum alatum]|uniref:Uncharacterized protein n=1 Tax=Sesamum alatum TaxID=300844 RepID=A0AAE2C9S7_9LAMI|nr:hypothetical protein Salat_2814800 [Sesamum alatum]